MLWLLAVVAAAYLSFVLLVLLFERRLIFFPDVGRHAGEPTPPDLAVEDVWLRTADGVRLHAWWIAAPGAEFTFLAFHGNAASIAARVPTYRFLTGMPAQVMAVEYRGYGRSTGVPFEAGLYRDAEAAYDWLVREKRIVPRQVIAFGQSLGTAVAVELATRREVGGVVLEAPFASTRAVARHIYWFLPGIGYFLRTEFDTGAKLARVSAPLLVVHCASDPVLPIALGEEVFRLAREPKMFLRIEGHCHEEAAQVAPDRYRATLRQFLDAVAARQP